MPGGRITALLQARVLGYVFNPISVFWCHDHGGTLRRVIVEVHNTYGQRHAYLLPPANTPVLVTKKLYVSPFNRWPAITRCWHRARTGRLDVVVSLHGDGQPAFVATLRGNRRPATVGHVVRMQIFSPLAPLVVALRIRIQGIALWLRRVPMMPRMTVPGDKRPAAIDPERWPAIVRVSSGPFAAAAAIIAKRLLHRAAARLPLRLRYPDGTVIGAGDAASPTR